MTGARAVRLFRDSAQQVEFEDRGAVALRVLTPAKARELRDIFASLDPADGFNSHEPLRKHTDGLHQTEIDSNRSYKQRVIEIACEWLEPVVADVLVGYRVLTATLFVKPPGGGMLPIHADPTMQEDGTWPTLFLWCALQDVDETNGAMRLVEGSHGLFRGKAGVTIIPGYHSCLDMLGERAVAKRLTAGEALVFDSSMFHGSFGNSSPDHRFALRLTCIPADRQGAMHRASKADPEIIETFRMEREDYADLDADGLLLGQFRTPKIGESRQPVIEVLPHQMEAILQRAVEIRSGFVGIESVLAQSDADRRNREKPSHLIHVGFPKCASKFLQLWFSAHPQIAYKTGMFAGLAGVHDLIASSIDASDPAICRVTSNEELSDPRDPNSFNEAETGDPSKRRERLERVCAELAALYPDAKILMIARNHVDILTSGFSQLVKQGGHVTETDLEQLEGGNIQVRNPFDFDFALQTYRKYFGGRVLALPYELLVDDRPAFLSAIADFMGVRHFDIPVGRVNESLDADQLYWYPRFARLLRHAPGGWLRRKLLALHCRFIRAGIWRPVLAVLRVVTGPKEPPRSLAPENLRKLAYGCDELLRLEPFTPYRELYRPVDSPPDAGRLSPRP